MRKVEEIRADILRYIAMERTSDYSKGSLDQLWGLAVRLRTELDELPASATVPFELRDLIRNIDFGAIKREYRSWVLDDAEKSIGSLKL
jgi:hypothetical protein